MQYKRSFIFLFLLWFIISCNNEPVEPQIAFTEKLQMFLNTSDKINLLDDTYFEGNINARISDELPSEEPLAKLSFEIIDYSIIPELENLFKNNGFNNFDFDVFIEFLKQNPQSGRTDSCSEIWTFYAFSNGVNIMMVCTDCSGEMQCMAIYQ